MDFSSCYFRDVTYNLLNSKGRGRVSILSSFSGKRSDSIGFFSVLFEKFMNGIKTCLKHFAFLNY